MFKRTAIEWAFIAGGKISESREIKRLSSQTMGLNTCWNGETKENNEVIRVIAVNLQKKWHRKGNFSQI